MAEGADQGVCVLTAADLPTPYDPNVAELDTEDQFVEAAFELLNETTFTVLPLVGSLRERPFQRDEAIRRALVQRLALLGKSMLTNAQYEHGYLQSAIGRQIIDAAATYLYLAEDEDGSRHKAYINNSLAEEKAALGIVIGQIQARGGKPLPIEKRMRRSMERMATAAGTTFDAVPGKAKSGWPRTEDRLVNVASVAYLPFRTGSSFIHASWASLLQGDLDEADDGFKLVLPDGPDVRPMTMAGILIADVAVDYLEGEGTEAEQAWFLDRLDTAARKTRELDEAHEQFLQAC